MLNTNSVKQRAVAAERYGGGNAVGTERAACRLAITNPTAATAGPPPFTKANIVLSNSGGIVARVKAFFTIMAAYG